MTTIKAIEEVADDYDGYRITCGDGTTYEFLIDNTQYCCETWGHFSSEDDLQSFIGAVLLGIHTTDTALKNTELRLKLEEREYDPITVADCIFVTAKTDRGDFQLAVYNAHNGYYGHPVLFKKNEEVLLDESL